MKYIYTLITDEEATNLHCNKNSMHSFLCFIFFCLWQIQCVKWFELLLGESMQWHGTLLAYRLSPWVPLSLQPDPLGRSSLQLFEGQSWSSQYRLGPLQGPPHYVRTKNISAFSLPHLQVYVCNLRHQAILFCGDEPDVKQILFTPDEQRFLTVSHKVIRILKYQKDIEILKYWSCMAQGSTRHSAVHPGRRENSSLWNSGLDFRVPHQEVSSSCSLHGWSLCCWDWAGHKDWERTCTSVPPSKRHLPPPCEPQVSPLQGNNPHSSLHWFQCCTACTACCVNTQI